jgi:hypothetical protein
MQFSASSPDTSASALALDGQEKPSPMSSVPESIGPTLTDLRSVGDVAADDEKARPSDKNRAASSVRIETPRRTMLLSQKPNCVEISSHDWQSLSQCLKISAGQVLERPSAGVCQAVIRQFCATSAKPLFTASLLQNVVARAEASAEIGTRKVACWLRLLRTRL